MFLAVKVVTAALAHGLFYYCNVFTTRETVHFLELLRMTIERANSNQAPGPTGGGPERATNISILETFFSIYYKWNLG
jgi:hypothetical protein